MLSPQMWSPLMSAMRNFAYILRDILLPTMSSDASRRGSELQHEQDK